MSAAIERRYPYGIGFLGAIAFFVAFPSFPVAADAAPSLFSATVSGAAIAVGFLATAKSILLSIDTKTVIVNLKKVGRYRELIDYLMMAIISSFLLAVMSVVCFIPDLKSPETWHRWYFAAWAGVMFAAGSSCFRIIHVFGRILRSAD